MLRQRLLKMACSLLLLLAGSAIYVLFRHDIIFVEMLPFSVPRIETDSSCRLTQFAIYSLPDALWYAALLMFMSAFADGRCLNRHILRFAIVLPFGLEAGQYLHIISGTFDIIDILSYLITLTICKWKLNLNA